MRTCLSRRGCSLAGLFLLALFASSVAAKPLSEQDVQKLIELQIDDDTIVAKLEKDGAGFAPEAEALKRLKAAGASDAVLAAVTKAAKSKAPAAEAPKGAAISYADVVKLLEAGLDEAAILKRLEKSPTKFVLDAKQVEQIKKLGGSDKLIAAMQGPGGPASADNSGNDITDFVILLDCSGSMDEQTPDGQIKMDVAKKAVASLVQGIPNGLKVMFVIYGHDKELACNAVKVVRPLGRIDDAGKNQLAETIAALKPVGGTPIALALKTAGTELAKNADVGTCGIVLISDGKESCKGDPSAEAAALAAKLKLPDGLTVIGFGVAGEERKSLEAIASAGKGKYLDAKDASSLEIAVKKVEAVAASSATATKRRSVRMLEPKMELPALKRIGMVKNGGAGPQGNYYPIAEIKQYGQVLRLPSTEKFDFWWEGQEGIAVRMISGLAIEERKLVDVKPEEHLGVLVITGTDLPQPKVVGVVVVGGSGPDGNFYPIQTSTKWGVPMVVPAGTYDIWLKDAEGGIAELIESKFEVAAGKITTIE
jgi:hypothetical protein